MTSSRLKAKSNTQNQRSSACKTKLVSRNVFNSSRWLMWTTCATKLCKSTSQTTSCKVMLEAIKTTSTWQDLKFKINNKLYCRLKTKSVEFKSNWKVVTKTFNKWNTSWDKWMRRFATLRIRTESTPLLRASSGKPSSMRCLVHMTSKRKWMSANTHTNLASPIFRRPCKTNSSWCSNKNSSKANNSSSNARYRRWPDTCKWWPSRTSSFQMSSNSFYRLMRCFNRNWTNVQPCMRLKKRLTRQSSAPSTTLSKPKPLTNTQATRDSPTNLWGWALRATEHSFSSFVY